MAKAKAYRVCWSYATVTLLDDFGGETVRGFYEGGILPANAKTESVQALLDKGAVEEVEAAESQEAEVVPPKNTIAVTAPKAPKVDKADDAKDAEATEQPTGVQRPAANASKADWVAYAVTWRDAGTSEEDARYEAEGQSKQALIDMYGG